MDPLAERPVERTMGHLDRVRESAGGQRDLLDDARAYAAGVLWTLHELGFINGQEWQELGSEVLRRLGIDPGDALPLPT